MDIKSFQADFINALFGGDKAPAVSYIIGDNILTAEQRFGIYSGSVHGILTQALGTMFPVCKSLVGDVFFNNMCAIFIDKNPPDTAFFAEYGSHFPVFIHNFKHAKDIHYLSDVARLEWIRQEIWHEEQSPLADFSGLANLSEDNQSKVVFNLSRRMRLIKSDYRIDELWFSHQKDSELNLEDIEMDHAVKLIIRRDKNIIKMSSFHETEVDNHFWDFLEMISKGSNFDILASIFGESLATYLSQAIQGGWIEGFTVEND